MPAGPLRARRHASRASLAASLLATTLLAAATSATAQDRPVPPWERQSRPTFGISVAGLYSSFDNTIASTDARHGFGFDAQAAIGVRGFALGLGFQRAVHAIDGAPGDVVYQGVFVEPRLAIPLAFDAFTPYAVGRIARIRRRADDDALGRAESADGVQYGGGLGVLVRIAPGVQLDVATLYSGFRLDSNGRPVAGPDPRRGTEGLLQLRAGVAVGLPGWGRE